MPQFDSSAEDSTRSSDSAPSDRDADAFPPTPAAEPSGGSRIRAVAELLARVREAEKSPDGLPAPLARAAELLRRKRRNGLSLEEAAERALASDEDVFPEPELIWEKPTADSQNVRERKFFAAEKLGSAFPQTRGALSRAAGTMTVSRWSAEWQIEAESAVNAFAEAAEKLGAAEAGFTAATGLLPRAGTLGAFKNLLRLAESLSAVRGEPVELVLGGNAEKELETLREAATLVECSERHKSLLSLPYPESAYTDPRLEEWLKTWNSAESANPISRRLKRRRVARALRELAGNAEKDPLDPRVDLGNLIALGNGEKEFKEKFAELERRCPSLIRGTRPHGALARTTALEKARAGTVEALAQLEDVPEKRDAWRGVIEKWIRGNEPAFAAGGAADDALAAAKTALGEFDARREELFETTGAAFSARASGVADVLAFAREMLGDREVWRAVCDWNAAALAAERRGMAAFASAIRAGTLPAENAKSFFEICYCRRWAEAVAEEEADALFAEA